MPFQKGNKLGAKTRIFEAEIRKVLTQDPNKLRAIAEKLVDMAADGNILAAREIADRLDGKAHQTFSGEIEHTVDSGDSSSLADRLGRRAATSPVADPTH